MLTKVATFLLAAVLVLTGCATTQQYVPAASKENLAAGNVLIQIERQEGFVGGGRSVAISDDGKVVGELSPGKSLIYQRPAGDFVLQLVPSTLAVSNPIPITIHSTAGKQYNFTVYWKGGFLLEQQ